MNLCNSQRCYPTISCLLVQIDRALQPLSHLLITFELTKFTWSIQSNAFFASFHFPLYVNQVIPSIRPSLIPSFGSALLVVWTQWYCNEEQRLWSKCPALSAMATQRFTQIRSRTLSPNLNQSHVLSKPALTKYQHPFTLLFSSSFVFPIFPLSSPQ